MQNKPFSKVSPREGRRAIEANRLLRDACSKPGVQEAIAVVQRVADCQTIAYPCLLAPDATVVFSDRTA